VDPDPAIFVNDLQDARKKLILKNFLLLFEGIFTSFFKGCHKEVTKQYLGINVFLTFFA
jgi:hypothetical protein